MSATHFALGLALLTSLSSSVAHATWSIVAVNTETGEVGAAGASCIGDNSVLIIYGAVPGRGALVAQAYYNQDGRDRGVAELGLGTSPEEIIGAITSLSFDPQSARRQYAVVDVQGRSAGFTGQQTTAYAEDRQSVRAPFVFSVQGNILTGVEVIDEASRAFEAPACDLAERLMNALEAGGRGGIGDGRCTPEGRSADSAFIAVEAVGGPGGERLELDVIGSAPADPTVRLREAFDAWRARHPCTPSVPPDAGAPDATAKDAGVLAPDAGRAEDGGGDRAEEDGGCSCRAGPSGARARGWAIGLLFFVGSWSLERLRRPSSSSRSSSRPSSS